MALSTDTFDPPPNPASSALDRDHLAQQTFGDRALQRELLALFRREAEASVASLLEPEAFVEGARRFRATGLVHTLCGSARAIGFWTVGAVAERLERRLRADDAIASSQRHDDVAALAEAVRDALSACDAFADSRMD